MKGVRSTLFLRLAESPAHSAPHSPGQLGFEQSQLCCHPCRTACEGASFVNVS